VREEATQTRAGKAGHDLEENKKGVEIKSALPRGEREKKVIALTRQAHGARVDHQGIKLHKKRIRKRRHNFITGFKRNSIEI